MKNAINRNVNEAMQPSTNLAVLDNPESGHETDAEFVQETGPTPLRGAEVLSMSDFITQFGGGYRVDSGGDCWTEWIVRWPALCEPA